MTGRILLAAFLSIVTYAVVDQMIKQREPQKILTPWGSVIGEEEEDTLDADQYTLEDIVKGGELIMLTLSGPETYYDYHGKGMGVHYLLCEKLAERLGVTLRVDVCRDTLDMLQRLKNKEGDIIAFPLAQKDLIGFFACAANWAVSKDNPDLVREVRSWYKPSMLKETKEEEQYLLTSASVKRRVYPFMLSARSGKISKYDHFFRRYAPIAGMEWTLMAAQCYQESCFDPNAHSWAGACGLMQIIPSTADHLKLPRNKMYDPEQNIHAAARYMRELQNHFNDVGSRAERIRFALAAYNGGAYHIRDAMRLTKKHGGNPNRWKDVRKYVLLLSQPEYYRDPDVQHGYMRGSETVNYVEKIMDRQSKYRHTKWR